MPHYPIAGKVVLVTGAASGIGRATARALHARGAHVVLADLRQDAVDAVRDELGREGALAVAVDVTDRSALDGVVAAAADRFGGLDVVVANAGIAADPPATVLKIDEAVFERVVEVDLLGVWRTVRAVLPQVVARRGHVLITSSIFAFANGMVNAPYAASKAAVEQLGRALRAELAGHGATAGVLCPGWVATPIADVAFGRDPLATMLVELAFPGPLRRPISPEKVAAAAVRGIERRARSTIVPARWAPLSALRGLVNPLIDRELERRAEVRALVSRMENRVADSSSETARHARAPHPSADDAG